MADSLQESPAKHFLCCHHRIAVDRHRIIHLPRIAARIRHHHRDIPRPRHAEHQFIPLLQAFNRQIQSAQLVLAIRVRPRDVAQKIRLELPQSRTERIVEPRQVIGVANLIRQVDVNR